MKSKLFAASFGAVALVCSAASAGDLKGFGSVDCYSVVNAWNASGAADRDKMLTAIGQWSFGYLSGRNATVAVSQRKELASLDNDQTAMFILNQCASYPGLYIYQIVDVIYDAAPYVGTGV
mgnify:FL=1